jgi:hypothetical protein
VEKYPVTCGCQAEISTNQAVWLVQFYLFYLVGIRRCTDQLALSGYVFILDGKGKVPTLVPI